jgi:hypothetical protein
MRFLVFIGLLVISFAGVGCSSSQQGVHRTAEWREPVDYGPQPGTENSVQGQHASAAWQGAQVTRDSETPWRLIDGKHDRAEVTRYVRAVVTHQQALAQHTDGGSLRGVDRATRSHLVQLNREVQKSRKDLNSRQGDLRNGSRSLAGAIIHGERSITGWDVINSLIEYELSQNTMVQQASFHR